MSHLIRHATDGPCRPRALGVRATVGSAPAKLPTHLGPFRRGIQPRPSELRCPPWACREADLAQYAVEEA